MATTKITELSAHTNPATTDVLPIVDVSEDSTKKIAVPELFKGVANGSEAAPAIAFASDSDTGIYKPGTGSFYDDQIAIATGGVNQATFVNDYLRFSQDFEGIQFNGNTSSLNAFDDYERGSFDPVIEGDSTAGTGTYTTQSGYYRKVGSVVSFNLHLEWTAHTGSGNMRIDGLPFVTSLNFHPVSVISSGISLITGYMLQAFIIPGNYMVGFWQTPLTTTSKVDVQLDSAGEIIIAGTYHG
jgi:hypothetical protein